MDCSRSVCLSVHLFDSYNRYFARFYLIVRLLVFVVYGITLSTIFFAFAAAIFYFSLCLWS